MKTPFRLLLALVLLTIAALPARADDEQASPGDERILQYHSRIQVVSDASLQVHETILVRALGEQIRHGIYRDFPTNYRDLYGNRYRVHFALEFVQRDGAPETARVEDTSSGLRIYLGDKNAFVPPGVHEYVLNYRVTRELGFFPDHDELYWNVTGNAWSFPIDRAAAVVTLPAAIPRSSVHLEGYTGPRGAREHNFSASLDSGEAVFMATRGFAPGEGLTIVVTWPKGYIAEPTSQQKFQWMLQDNRAALVALLGLVLVVFYEAIAWWMVGRDPRPGVIMPLYDPPAGLSPAAVRFVEKMHFDNKAFAAVLVSLAAKGYLEISQDTGLLGTTYVFKKTGRSVPLTPDELTVGQCLFRGGNTLRLDSTSHADITLARKALKSSLATSMEKIYFVTNRKYLVPGLIGSALTYLAVVAAAEPQGRPIALFMTLWLSGWTFGVIMLALRVVSLWRGAFHARGLAKISYIGAIFMTAFALPFFAGEIFGLFTMGTAISFFALLALAAIAAANFIFHELLKAPTHSGRDLLDKIDGFKMFLGAVTDKDRPGIAVNNDVATFEKYLPHAMALDLEEQWTAKFSHALAAAAAAGATSAGTAAMHAVSLSSLASSAGGISDFTGSFTSAVDSVSAPGSSSGSGGGGSSGGGGGGGGGGGW